MVISRVDGYPIHDQESFARLGPEWDELFSRANCEDVFLSYDWMAEWWKHWGAHQELFVIAVRAPGGRLVAIAPFYIRRSRLGWLGPRTLSFLGSEGTASDHLNVLAETGVEDAAIREIVRLIVTERKCWDYIELADGDAGSMIFMELRRELREAGLQERLTPRPARPYAQLPASFEEYLAGLTHRVRKNFRRALRSLESAGAVNYLCLTDNAEIQARFGELVRLHSGRFEQLGKESCFLEPRLQAFHSGLLKRMAERPWPRLFLLQIGSETVAALYGFSIGKRFSFYQSGMDPAWAELSVGMVALGCGIRYSIESGHEQFDFLRGTPAYKLHWTKDSSRQAVTARFFDRRLKSRIALAPFVLRNWAARIKRAVKQRRGPRPVAL